MLLHDLFTSVEDVELEVERVWYGYIKDFDELKKAFSVEEQEQWETHARENHKSMTTRVRKIGNSRVLTVKVRQDGMDGKYEINLPMGKEDFETFKIGAFSGFIKDRYLFKIDNNLTWEIDVYRDKHDKQLSLVKIDLEVPNYDYPVPDFPIEFTDVWDGHQMTDKQAKLVNEFFRVTCNRAR